MPPDIYMHSLASQIICWSSRSGLIVVPCWKAGDTQALAPATEEQAREAAAPDRGAAGEDADEAMPDAGVASDEEETWQQPEAPDEQPHEVGTCLNARQMFTPYTAVKCIVHPQLHMQQMQKGYHSKGMA